MSAPPLLSAANGVSLPLDPAESSIPSKSLLSDKAILDHLSKGSGQARHVDRVLMLLSHVALVIRISYDVTLGRYYFRESAPEPGMGVYNPVRTR
jgi:hypothetical protein